MRLGLSKTRLWCVWRDDDPWAPEAGTPIQAELIDERVAFVIGEPSSHHVSRYEARGYWFRRIDLMTPDKWLERYPYFVVSDAELVHVVDEYWNVHLPPVWDLDWPQCKASHPLTLEEREDGLRRRLESAVRHGVPLRRVLDRVPTYARGKAMPNWMEIVKEFC
ncbi:MAG TPA: hypothetical protein VIG24_12920 [Acidimicrobiia bacterium]